MSFLLTDVFDDCFVWNNQKYKVDLSYDNILRLFEMFDDIIILNVEKPFLAIRMLIDDVVKFDSIDEVLSLFKFLMNEFLGIDVDNQEEGNEVKTFDFKKDAEAIYSSFVAEYNIDLFEVKGELHWKKFIALLNNLGDESSLKKIIGIRTMNVPSTEEATQEYRDHIVKMKEVYSLDERTKEEKFDNVFDDFAKMLR